MARAVATWGISVYIPPKNQSALNFFLWLFCLLDPGQIRVNIYTHPNQIPGYASDGGALVLRMRGAVATVESTKVA